MQFFLIVKGTIVAWESWSCRGELVIWSWKKKKTRQEQVHVRDESGRNTNELKHKAVIQKHLHTKHRRVAIGRWLLTWFNYLFFGTWSNPKQKKHETDRPCTASISVRWWDWPLVSSLDPKRNRTTEGNARRTQRTRFMRFALILDRKTSHWKNCCRGKILVVEKYKTRASKEGEWKDQQRPWHSAFHIVVLIPVLARSKTNTRHHGNACTMVVVVPNSLTQSWFLLLLLLCWSWDESKSKGMMKELIIDTHRPTDSAAFEPVKLIFWEERT